MDQNDAINVIMQMVDVFALDKAKLAEHIKPTPAIIIPMGGKFDEGA